jgi:hypothetical protein
LAASSSAVRFAVFCCSSANAAFEALAAAAVVLTVLT